MKKSRAILSDDDNGTLPSFFRQVAILRNKHASQQKIVNKLIQFLVTMVQPGAAARMTATGAVSPAVAASIKRKFVSPLAIEDDSGPSSSKEPRLSAVRCSSLYRCAKTILQ